MVFISSIDVAIKSKPRDFHDLKDFENKIVNSKTSQLQTGKEEHLTYASGRVVWGPLAGCGAVDCLAELSTITPVPALLAHNFYTHLVSRICERALGHQLHMEIARVSAIHNYFGNLDGVLCLLYSVQIFLPLIHYLIWNFLCIIGLELKLFEHETKLLKLNQNHIRHAHHKYCKTNVLKKSCNPSADLSS